LQIFKIHIIKAVQGD